MFPFQKYEFKKRSPQWVDAGTAIRKINKGKRILIGSGCAEPQMLVKALVKNASCFRDNEIVHLLTVGIAPYTDSQYADSFRHNAFFIGKNVRDAVNEGHADYIPIFLSEIPMLFKTGQMPIHAALVQVSPPNDNNEVSLGVSVDINTGPDDNGVIGMAVCSHQHGGDAHAQTYQCDAANMMHAPPPLKMSRLLCDTTRTESSG